MQETDEHPGTVLVAAAGNESRRHLNPDFVIDVSIPAAAALDMISVGAIMRSDLEGCCLNVAPFSNINPRSSSRSWSRDRFREEGRRSKRPQRHEHGLPTRGRYRCTLVGLDQREKPGPSQSCGRARST